MDVNRPKLGEVIQDGKFRCIATSIYPPGFCGSNAPLAILTAIPDGMEPEDLGRKFYAAGLTILESEPWQHIGSLEDLPK